MGRAAVLEELQIELDVLGQTLLLGLLLQHFVAVLTLGTCGDLHAAPDQVVALRHTVLITHMVESTLLGRVISDEQELVAVVLLDPVVAQTLGFSGQVALLALVHGVAELFLQSLVQVCQLDHRERGGGHDDFLPEQLLDLVAIAVLNSLQTGGQQLLFHLHHVLEGGDVAELQIEAGELGSVLVGIALLGAEHGTGLEDTLKTGSHSHLLVELRALCQIGVAVEVIHLEHLRAALAGSSDQLGGVDLDEVAVQQELAHGVDKAALCLEHQLVLVGAQVDPAVVDALVDAGALHSLLFLGGCDLLADDGQCIGGALHLNALGDHLHAAHLDVIVLHHLAGNGDDRVRGELVDGIHQFGVVGLFHRDLQLAGNILQHDKCHILAVAQVLDKALHLHRAADGLLSLIDIGAFHNTGILL